jgi:crotonobetainyl-CoA:carnitine CoA-transferase CaiB-like acyl-CoA transferase
MFSMEQHPTEGAYRVVRSPVQFAAPFQLRHHAPRLGEDSVAVLEEAGFSGAEIEGFLRDGVVHAPLETLAG